jgi:hypothetical protein
MKAPATSHRLGQNGVGTALSFLTALSNVRDDGCTTAFSSTDAPNGLYNSAFDRMSYLSEKFASARSALMLAHVKGEISSIAAAMQEASLGLSKLNRSLVDPSLQGYLRQLDALMDTTGLSDPKGEGLHTVKARTFSVDQQAQFSNLVDEIASLSRN